jgi:hypothetical protein
MEKIDVWLMLAREKYPEQSDQELKALSMTAAAHWFNDHDTDLAKLFDQYVMMKNLYGIDGLMDVR